jgi:hypothetical protein
MVQHLITIGVSILGIATLTVFITFLRYKKVKLVEILIGVPAILAVLYSIFS